ncbi:MAG: 2Fe-2S iron-sulfur cluster-binding protein, partial [bacterium]
MATVVHQRTGHPEQPQNANGVSPTLTCTIDGEVAEFTDGETILEVIRRIGHRHHVPSLCYDPQLAPFGACRVCLVEIEGQAKPVASCHTPLRAGVSINTRSERVERLR